MKGTQETEVGNEIDSRFETRNRKTESTVSKQLVLCQSLSRKVCPDQERIHNMQHLSFSQVYHRSKLIDVFSFRICYVLVIQGQRTLEIKCHNPKILRKLQVPETRNYSGQWHTISNNVHQMIHKISSHTLGYMFHVYNSKHRFQFLADLRIYRFPSPLLQNPEYLRQ